jgi:hypothetical protein
VIVRLPRRPAAAAAAGAGRPWRWLAAAAAAFAALCIVALSTAPQLAEPDDHAYQASIIAATQGHWLTLSTAQVHALGAQFAQVGPSRRLAGGPGGAPPAPVQWVQLSSGSRLTLGLYMDQPGAGQLVRTVRERTFVCSAAVQGVRGNRWVVAPDGSSGSAAVSRGVACPAWGAWDPKPHLEGPVCRMRGSRARLGVSFAAFAGYVC